MYGIKDDQIPFRKTVFGHGGTACHEGLVFIRLS